MAARKLTLKDVALNNRRVLIRCDFNVKLREGRVVDNLKVQQHIPTIQYALEQGARAVILMSTLGKPQGRKVPELSLEPIAHELSALLEREVIFVHDCVGAEASKACAHPEPGSVILLENLRFHAEEDGYGVDNEGKIVGDMLVDESQQKLAQQFLDEAAKHKVEVRLPSDYVAQATDNERKHVVFDLQQGIPQGFVRSESSADPLIAAALQDQLIRSLNSSPFSRLSSFPQFPLRPRKPIQKIKISPVTSIPRPAFSGFTRTSNPISKPNKDLERVLDPLPPPLTLAQRMGLVDAPHPLLDEHEWLSVKEQSNSRADSSPTAHCPVCLEPFALRSQVLLSCSHVFHLACLEAFERLSGKRICPLCRHSDYQKRLIHEGAQQFRHCCATKIQALWRGFRVRKWFRELRKRCPPLDPVVRRKFFLSELSEITDRLERSMDASRSAALNGDQYDQNVAQFRQLLRLAESAAARRARGECVAAPLSADDWLSVATRVLERNDSDCPICLGAMQLQSLLDSTVSLPESDSPTINAVKLPPIRSATPSKSNPSIPRQTSSKFDRHNSKARSTHKQSAPPVPNRQPKTARPLALLSCSHVFHACCLDALERLTACDRRGAMEAGGATGLTSSIAGVARPICPVCRAVYVRKP